MRVKSRNLCTVAVRCLLAMTVLSMAATVYADQYYKEQAALGDRGRPQPAMAKSDAVELNSGQTDGISQGATGTMGVFGSYPAPAGAILIILFCSMVIFALLRFRRRLQNEVAMRRLAETAVRQSEQRLSLVIDHTADMIFFYDTQGQFKIVNQSACDRLGYPKEALVQLGVKDVDAKFRDNNDLFHVWQSFKDEGATIIETQLRSRDDEKFPVEVNLKRFRFQNEPWVLAVARDIGPRKIAEAQQRSSHKMEALGTLSGGIAHDFNNILGIILGSAELAMDDVPPTNPARGCLKEIKKAARRARDIVRQILAYTRKAVEERAPINLATSVEASLKLVRATVPATIAIETKFQNSDIVVLANATQISQIVVNLCSNAGQAMQQNGGVMTIDLKQCKPSDPTLNAYPEVPAGICAVLSVSDTGPGIAPEVIDRIFDPYFTTKKGGQGTGMGLAVVHGTVKMMGGYIYSNSIMGEGTRMVVLLPVVAAKARSLPNDTIRIPRGSERVMFVDDEPAMVRFCKHLLERLGYHVMAYTDPIKALASFRKQPDRYDLVITDMTMPGMTGDKMALEMMKIRADIPVVLCTGHSEWLDEKAALDIGIKAFHMKPFDRMELAATIRIVLDGEGRFHGQSDRHVGMRMN